MGRVRYGLREFWSGAEAVALVARLGAQVALAGVVYLATGGRSVDPARRGRPPGPSV